MDLKDLAIPSETVQVPHGKPGEFVEQPVWGLEPSHIAYLLQEQREALEHFYAKAAAGEMEVNDYSVIASQLVDQAPVLLGSILACGFGQPDKAVAEKLARLPFTVQLDALEKIGRLTFAAEGGVKKVLETVVRMMTGITQMQDSPPPSLSGLGAFGDR